jgi:hypothetical protein
VRFIQRSVSESRASVTWLPATPQRFHSSRLSGELDTVTKLSPMIPNRDARKIFPGFSGVGAARSLNAGEVSSDSMPQQGAIDGAILFRLLANPSTLRTPVLHAHR